MPQTCTVCRNPQREAIDAALVAGEPLRNIAKRFGTSPSAVLRHRKKDLSPALIRASEAREDDHEKHLIDQVQALIAKAGEILNDAENQRTALVAVRELRGTLELLAKLTGELHPETGPRDWQPLFSLPAGTRISLSVPEVHTINVTPKPENAAGAETD